MRWGRRKKAAVPAAPDDAAPRGPARPGMSRQGAQKKLVAKSLAGPPPPIVQGSPMAPVVKKKKKKQPPPEDELEPLEEPTAAPQAAQLPAPSVPPSASRGALATSAAAQPAAAKDIRQANTIDQSTSTATPAAQPRSMYCTVKLGTFALQLTISEDFLVKPLAVAVIRPFIDAYNKKNPKAKIGLASCTTSASTPPPGPGGALSP